MNERDYNYSKYSATARLMIMLGVILFFIGFVFQLTMGLSWDLGLGYLPVNFIVIIIIITFALPLIITFFVRPLSKMTGVRSFPEMARPSGTCPVCGRPVPFDAVYCPYCGERISPSEDRSYSL
ncbi:MAG: hypothetical protein ACTSYL_02080 [Candidatus Thorarchaeota archaeon]